MIKEVLEDAEQFVRNLSARDQLYIILLVTAVVRSFFVFMNFDSTVYQMWLEYFLKTGQLPYYDHPPLFFLITGGLEIIFQSLQRLHPAVYWSLSLPPFFVAYRFTKERSPYLFGFLIYILSQVFLVGYLGNLYEIGLIVSVMSGVAFVYVSYLIGSLRGEKVGIYAAIFTSITWWPLVYSNSLLIDIFASVLVTASYYLYYLLVNAENPSRFLYVSTALVLVLAFYSKYYALILLLPIGVYTVYLHMRELDELLKRLTPAAAATLIFGFWALYTNFYFLNHYATTHYRFLVMPSLSSFSSFLLQAFTPLIIVLAFFGYLKLYREEEINYAFYLLVPVVTGLVFYFSQAFLLRRSHSLINLTNYMLYSFPLIAAAAAKGWLSLKLDVNRFHILSVVLVLTLIPPLLGSGVWMEYDKDYLTPSGNLNTLSKNEFQSLGIPQSRENTLHYVQNFQKDFFIWSSYKRKKAHFRWLSPTEIKIVALEPTRYRVTLKSSDSVNTTLVNDSGQKKRIHIEGKKTIYIQADEGVSNYRFKSDEKTPFRARQINCRKVSDKCKVQEGEVIW